jgi:Terpene synthase family 2, C-terminal metal binding
MDDYGIPLLVGLSHPSDLPPDAWFAITQYFLWISAVDDKIGESGRPLSAYLQSFGTILRHGQLPDVPDMLHNACADIRISIIRAGGEALLAPFAQSLDDVITSWGREQQWRTQGLPRLAEYLDVRKTVIGVYPGLLLGRLHPGMLPPSEPIPPSVDRLIWLACLIIAVENDLFSAYKESQQGAVLTLLDVIADEYGIDIFQAMTCALSIRTALRNQHDDILADIAHDTCISPAARRWAKHLGKQVDTYYSWQMSSERYQLKDIPASTELCIPPPAH